MNLPDGQKYPKIVIFNFFDQVFRQVKIWKKYMLYAYIFYIKHNFFMIASLE